MPDAHYEDPRLAALYDVESGWSEDRTFYLEQAGETPRKILDLGCGTGLICDAYAAKGHDVTGVDPARAMLEIARQKQCGNKIHWVQSFAESFRSAERFDLIIMTGHAFQVLISEDAFLGTLAVMRTHLAPGGKAVFESRNPAIDWKARWEGEKSFQADAGSWRQTRRVLRQRPSRIQFETRYHFAQNELVSVSDLIFRTRREIEDGISTCGLSVTALYGDWTYGPFDSDRSDEMVFVVQGA